MCVMCSARRGKSTIQALLVAASFALFPLFYYCSKSNPIRIQTAARIVLPRNLSAKTAGLTRSSYHIFLGSPRPLHRMQIEQVN